MRKYTLATLAAVVALSPALGRAEGPSYSFLDAGYVTTNVDNFNGDVDGFLLRGSFEFTDNWFGYARYMDQSTDIAGTNVDVTQWSIGDKSVLPFVDRFYATMAGGATVGDALRETKLAAIRDHARIADWAAFTVIGDASARPSLRRRNLSPLNWLRELTQPMRDTSLRQP